MSGQLPDAAALKLGGKARGTHWIGDCVPELV